LDGVQARRPKMSNYNNGNVPYELFIRHNTIITNLIYEPFMNQIIHLSINQFQRSYAT